MGKNHRGRPVLQRSHHNFPGIHRGPVQGTQKEVFTAQDPVLVIQKQAGEHLPAAGAEVVVQEAPGLLRAGQRVAGGNRLQGLAPGELERRLQCRKLPCTHPGTGLQ